MTIHVCSLYQVKPVLMRSGAKRVVTLLTDPTKVPHLPDIETAHRLVLHFNDIVELTEGLILPSEQHMRDFIAFTESWDNKTPMLIHCWAGISRSTAGAFITACMHAGSRSERDIAQALRNASATASPNLLLVAMADKLLGRGGRMVAAVEAIGRGVVVEQGTPFFLNRDDYT